MVLLIEVCLMCEGEAAGSELNSDAIMNAAASEAVSLFSFARKCCLGANAVQQRGKWIHAIRNGLRLAVGTVSFSGRVCTQY